MIDRNHAQQIADLLNSQNQLTVQYDADRVFDCKNNYLVRLDDSGRVIACAELKLVQWYQHELLHVTVAQQHIRRGHARSLIAEAVDLAVKRGARILQSTIRIGNVASEQLFQSSGFQPVCHFYNARSGNTLGVWQRVLSPPKPPIDQASGTGSNTNSQDSAEVSESGRGTDLASASY